MVPPAIWEDLGKKFLRGRLRVQFGVRKKEGLVRHPSKDVKQQLDMGAWGSEAEV